MALVFSIISAYYKHMSNKSNVAISISVMSIITILVVFVAGYGVWQLWNLVLVVLVAVVLSSFVITFTRTIATRRFPRIATIILVYIFVFLVIGTVLYLFIPIFIKEVTELTGKLDMQELSTSPTSIGNILSFVQGFSGSYTKSIDILTRAQESLKVLPTANILQILTIAFGGVTNFILIVVLSLYLSVNEKSIESFIRIISPLQYEEYAVSLWLRVEEKIGKWLRGQMVLAFILAVLTYIGLWIFDVPYALMLALLAAVFSLIPFGIIFAGLVAIGVAFLAGGLKLAVIVLLMYFILQQIENYILQPLIIRSITGVPSTIILLSLVVFGTLWGFLGVILALPIAVLLVEVVKDYDIRKRMLTMPEVDSVE